MRTLRLVLVAAALLCAVVVAVGGYRLAGATDAPSLGSPIVVRPAATTSTVGGSGNPSGGRPTQATSTSSRAPSATAVQVSPPPVQDAGDDDPDDEVDDEDGD